MTSKDFVSDGACKRHVFKEIVELLEHRLRVIDVLIQTVATLITEACLVIDLSIFM